MKDSFLQFLALTKRAGRLVEGYNKCEEIIKSKKAFLCIVSKDISVNSHERFLRLCESNNIHLIHDYNKESLGTAIGRKEISVLCVTDLNMSNRLRDIFYTNQNNRG